MLDVISGGRLVAGFPVGTAMDTNYCYGEVPATLREKYREAHDLIIRAWTEPDVFSFNGKYTKLRYVNLWPKPLQQPRPPVWIPGGGSVETWDFCAEHDYQYSFLSFFGYVAAKKVADGYWATMARKGKPLNPYSMAFAQGVVVAESDEQAERDFAPHADYFYNRCLHVYPSFADAPGYRTLNSIRAAMQSGLPAQLKPHYSWKDLVNEGIIIAGSPKTVRERLREAMRSLNCGHMITGIHMGSMPPELVRKSTELFAREVMPYLRDMWSDWEDKWSPRPLAENERAMPSPVNFVDGESNGRQVAADGGNGEPARSMTK
jgi:alkanesulfonate monooxygenase SsuD/methylene tetrahydromethanopterin reductase-like flavin-dependent oxidoreductase (luciferase family)